MIKAQYSPLNGGQKILCKIGLTTFLVCGSLSLTAGLLFLSHQFNKLDLILKPIYRILKKLQLDSEPLEKFSTNITRMFGQGFTSRRSIIMFGSLVFLFLLSCYTAHECCNLLQKGIKEYNNYKAAQNNPKKTLVASSAATVSVEQATTNTTAILPEYNPAPTSNLAAPISASQSIGTTNTIIEDIQITSNTVGQPMLEV